MRVTRGMQPPTPDSSAVGCAAACASIPTVSTLHRHSFGDGGPVLALHGVTGHGERWRVLADALPDHRLIGVDLRGHGRSPWTPPWGFEQHVADLLAVLDAEGLDRVPVIGHSFGGAIAVHLTRIAPERVERLVLLDPAIGLDAGDMLETAEDTRADESYPDLDAARADRAQRWEGIAAELVEAELAAHLVPDGDRWRYRYSRAAVVAAWGEMARAAVTPVGPTLLVPATKADFVDPAWVDACRAALGDDLTVAPVDAGHMVFLERTAEVAEHIRAFLR
ncbi:alpha/beta hydrolase [Pseudonocardia petroleophila]